MGSEFQWIDIHNIAYKEKKKRQERRENNKKYYDLLTKYDYGNIDLCVKHALKTGCHAAFVRYYREIAETANVLYGKKLNEHVKKRNMALTECYDFKVMKKKELLDKNITPDAYRQDYEKFRKKFYQKQMVTKWFGKEHIEEDQAVVDWSDIKLPGKYSVVQIGISLDLDVNEVNELLQLSDNEMLYVRDSVDAVCYYMIQHLHENGKSLPSDEKLKKLKEALNKYATQDTYTVKLGTLKEGGYTEKYEKEIDIHKYHNLEDFMRNRDFISFRGAAQEMAVMFSDKRKSMRKNIYISSAELKCSEDEKEEVILQRMEDLLLERKTRYLTGWLNDDYFKTQIKKGPDVQRVRAMIDCILDTDADVIYNNKELVDDPDSCGKNRSIPSKYYAGEKVGKEYRHLNNVNHDLKKNKIMYCLACGKEDHIGGYLCASKFWPEDWTKIERSDEKMEKIDAILIYAMHYRDGLINRWTDIWKKETHASEAEVRIQRIMLKDKYPMIRQIIEIQEDIKFLLSEKEKAFEVQFLFVTEAKKKMQYTKLKCTEFTEKLSTKAPVPGGGGTAALVGALSASLCSMVGNLTVEEEKYNHVKAEIKRLIKNTKDLRVDLLDLVERDAEEFESLSKAYGMEKETEEQIAEKEQAMEDCLKKAADVQILIMKKVCEIIDVVDIFCEKESVLAVSDECVAVSDAGVAAAFAAAALNSAALNVFVNTGLMKNKEKAAEINQKCNNMLSKYIPMADKSFGNVSQKLQIHN